MSRVIIVTGASKGIGEAIARKLSDFRLVLTARNTENLEKLKQSIQNDNPNADILTVTADVTREDEVKKVIHSTIQKFNSVDVLINNAGIGKFKRCDEFSAAEFMEVYSVNMFGTFLFTKYALPYMIEKKKGQIINIASVAGLNGFKNGTAYASSKFAMMGFTESLREDVKEYGIAVSAICPGGVLTEFGGKDLTVKNTAPFMLEPSDVAHSVRYLVEESETANTKLIELKPRKRMEYR